jgi:hypothetical protein
MNDAFELYVNENFENYKTDDILEDTLKLDDPRIWIWLSNTENQGFMNEDFIDFFTI